MFIEVWLGINLLKDLKGGQNPNNILSGGYTVSRYIY